MIDKIGAVIIREKKMLVARNASKEVFFIPGGKREPGETDEQTLHREITEELGVSVKKSKFYRQINTRNYNDTADLKLRLYLTEIDGEPRSSGEIAELMWVGKHDYEASKHRISKPLQIIIEMVMKDRMI